MLKGSLTARLSIVVKPEKISCITESGSLNWIKVNPWQVQMSLCINPQCSNPENRDTSLFCQSCGSELLLEGRYRVIKGLGGGGFGKTYEVQDNDPNNLNTGHSTIKVLKVLLHNHPKYVELFEREVHVLSRLNHPGIPKVQPDAHFKFEVSNSNIPLYCLVMEKIEGLNLSQYITKRGKCISQKVAIQWLMQLLRILEEIHHHNFFHTELIVSSENCCQI